MSDAGVIMVLYEMSEVTHATLVVILRASLSSHMTDEQKTSADLNLLVGSLLVSIEATVAMDLVAQRYSWDGPEPIAAEEPSNDEPEPAATGTWVPP